MKNKNKTLATWLAFAGGQLGIHRIYLYGWRDGLAWIHPLVAALGWWGVQRVRQYGQDDQLAWVLVPLLGFTLATTALTAIYYGLMAPEKWNARHNPGAAPDSAAGKTNWLVMAAVIFALLFGTIALMSSIVFSFQRYFEYQATNKAPTLVATRTALPPRGGAAPATRRSRFRGPCLKERAPTCTRETCDGQKSCRLTQ